MTSSVQLAKSKIPSIPGTKPSIQNAQLLISTGVPSLDHVIGLYHLLLFEVSLRISLLPKISYVYRVNFTGGGLPVGTIILVGK